MSKVQETNEIMEYFDDGIVQTIQNKRMKYDDSESDEVEESEENGVDIKVRIIADTMFKYVK